MIAALDGSLAATGGTVNPADIDDLTSSAQTMIASLQADAQNVAAQNAALQAELDKAAAPVPVPTAPTAPAVPAAPAPSV